MTRTVVVCADDYAFSPSVSTAIVELAERGRISATSCMVGSPFWREHAQRLLPLRDRIDIGLHLTLVDEAPLMAMPRTAPHGRLPDITSLILKSHLGLLALDEIAAEIDAQCAAFTTVMGIPPAYIDGHLHSHVLPGIRDLVLKRAAAMSPRPYLRNIAEPVRRIMARGVAIPKTLILTTLGRSLTADAQAAGLATNDGFSGVYSLAADANVAVLFERFVGGDALRPIIMCHPGAANDDSTPLAAARANEFRYLSGDDFPALLQRHDLSVGRFA